MCLLSAICTKRTCRGGEVYNVGYYGEEHREVRFLGKGASVFPGSKPAIMFMCLESIYERQVKDMAEYEDYDIYEYGTIVYITLYNHPVDRRMNEVRYPTFAELRDNETSYKKTMIGMTQNGLARLAMMVVARLPAEAFVYQDYEEKASWDEEVSNA